MRKIILASLIMGSAITLGGCARNLSGEGAAVGSAVGAAGGSQIRKRDNRCYQVDRYGREYEVRC